jgi:hypothetical protein
MIMAVLPVSFRTAIGPDFLPLNQSFSAIPAYRDGVERALCIALAIARVQQPVGSCGNRHSFYPFPVLKAASCGE